jgi:hypothetical protein
MHHGELSHGLQPCSTASLDFNRVALAIAALVERKVALGQQLAVLLEVCSIPGQQVEPAAGDRTQCSRAC